MLRRGIHRPPGVTPDLHPLTLRFASDELERAWRDARAVESVGHFRAVVVLAIGLYVGFVALDHALLADVAGRLLAVRGITIGLLLGFLAVSRRPVWHRLHDWIVAGAVLVAGGGIVALLAVGREEAQLHWAGLMLALMATYGLFRPRLPVTVALSAALVAAFDAVALGMGVVPVEAALADNFFLVAAAFIGFITCYGLERASRERFLAMRRLEDERRRSEALLLNILPESIARRLEAGEEPIADEFAEVTVLFADIVGFTAMTAGMPPAEMVGLLDRVFNEFDRIARDHGVEKVKTIGDACMMASGVPEPEDEHAGRIAEAALAIRQRVAACGGGGGEPIRLRIGIATGPVVAGVIGRTRFSYDLWGDVVNTASRMASLGEDDRIQVTAEVAERLEDRYLFRPRGTLEVKGKGPMETWYLEERREVAVPAGGFFPPPGWGVSSSDRPRLSRNAAN